MWERRELAAFFLEVLEGRLGIPAQIDEDDDVVFEVEGLRLFVQNPAPADPAYLRVILGARFEGADLEQLAEVARQTNRRWKAVKAVAWGEVLELACESFAAPTRCRPDPDHLAATLPRTIEVLCDAMRAAARLLSSGSGSQHAG